MSRYTIAIDFDGTLCIGNKFPIIGEPRDWLIEKAIKWREEGHKLILWTCREDVYEGELSVWRPGMYLTEAVEWCRERGLEFDAVNQSVPEKMLRTHKFSRKIFADFYIDDKAMIFDDDNNSILGLDGVTEVEFQ